MSDKFVVSSNEVGAIIVTDVETGNVYRYGNIYKFFGLIRLLNELSEENEQLRQQVQNAKEIAVKNDMQYQICRKEKEDFQDMCEQLRNENKEMRHELDSLSGCYCADNKEFKDYWRIEYGE